MQGIELPHATPRRLTRSEYERIAELGVFDEERVELIRGIVVRMSPIGPPHSDVVDRLAAFFFRALGDRARVRVQQPYVAHDDSEPEPDVAIVPLASYAARHPDQALLIVEVAETSLSYDRETKAPLYAESGAAEYWIVDVYGRAIGVFSDPDQGRYQRVVRLDAHAELAPGAFPDATLAIHALFD